jgi:hypothetical protein
MTTYVRNRYDRIAVDPGSIQQLLECMTVSQQTSYKGALKKQFEQEEIYHAIRAGGRMKAPGRDGIVSELYTRNWNIIRADMYDIYNQILWEGCSTPNQKHGVIICLPKKQGGHTPKDYRPIPLLSTDYKVLARMVA